jgi:hypothetical protein
VLSVMLLGSVDFLLVLLPWFFLVLLVLLALFVSACILVSTVVGLVSDERLSVFPSAWRTVSGHIIPFLPGQSLFLLVGDRSIRFLPLAVKPSGAC